MAEETEDRAEWAVILKEAALCDLYAQKEEEKCLTVIEKQKRRVGYNL